MVATRGPPRPDAAPSSPLFVHSITMSACSPAAAGPLPEPPRPPGGGPHGAGGRLQREASGTGRAAMDGHPAPAASPLIYLDHAATTAVRPEVVAAMQPFWARAPATPRASTASAGRPAAPLDECARRPWRPCSAPARRRCSSPAGAPKRTTLAIKGVGLRPPASAAHHIITSADRAPRRAAHLRVAGAVRLPDHLPAGRPLRPGRSGRRGGRHHRRDGADHDHVRQQRDRHDRAAGRDRAHRPRARQDPVPHRRGAGRRRARPERATPGRRPAVALRRTSSTAQGRGRALRPRRHALAAPAAGRRARSGTAAPGRRTSPASRAGHGALRLATAEQRRGAMPTSASCAIA